MSLSLLLFRGRNVTQRIKKALDELAREISREIRRKQQQGYGLRNPVPVPVAVPARNRPWNVCQQFRRHFSTCPYNFSGRAHCRPFKFRFINIHLKFFKNYQTRSLRHVARWGANGGFRDHFTHNHLQNLLRHRFLNQQPSRNLSMGVRLLSQLKEDRVLLTEMVNTFHPTRAGRRHASSASVAPFYEPVVPSLIRLNLLLTPQHHDAALQIATEPRQELVSQGCYVDFPINAHLTIPTATFLTDEVLLEVMDNLQSFEKQLAELKLDLARLFDLGELPIKYLVNKNVLRVHFPNCDRVQLEALLRDKNIQGGIIYEDMSLRYVESSPTVTDTDILSSFGLSSMLMSLASSDVFSEELPEPLSDENVIRPVAMEAGVGVRINDNESDEFYWVSA